jgi:hypothetical protein
MRTQAGGLWGKVGVVALGALLLGGCVARTQSAPGKTWTPVYSPGRGPRPAVQAPVAETSPEPAPAPTPDPVFGRPGEMEPPPTTGDTPPEQFRSSEVSGTSAGRRPQPVSGKAAVDDLLGPGKGKKSKSKKK